MAAALVESGKKLVQIQMNGMEAYLQFILMIGLRSNSTKIENGYNFKNPKQTNCLKRNVRFFFKQIEKKQTLKEDLHIRISDQHFSN